jgi:hypothetical protein
MGTGRKGGEVEGIFEGIAFGAPQVEEEAGAAFARGFIDD